MALKDIFKSPEERRREERRARRRAFREAERAIEKIKSQIKELEAERDKLWEDAKNKLKRGDKHAAKRALEQYRKYDAKIYGLNMIYLSAKSKLVSLSSADIYSELRSAFQAITRIINIDVDKTADVLEEVREVISDMKEEDKLWAENQEEIPEEVGVPTLDELEEQLQDEVAEEITSYASEKEKNSIKSDIESAEERLKKLLEGE